MLKLIKYEFRKARTSLTVLLGIIAVLQIAYMVSLRIKNLPMMVGAAALLGIMSLGAAIYVFCRGISGYSGELNSRTGYMVFMTPLPTWQVVASKLLYTFLNGLLFFALLSALAYYDFRSILTMEGTLNNALASIRLAMQLSGIYMSRLLAAGAYIVLFLLSRLICVVSLAYLAITVSNTLLRDKKWRWIPTLIMFFLLLWGVNVLCGLFPTPISSATLVDATGSYSPKAIADTLAILEKSLLPSLLPTWLVSLGVIVATTVACSEMLKRRISL